MPIVNKLYMYRTDPGFYWGGGEVGCHGVVREHSTPEMSENVE